jgi:hypothetical protein
MVPAAHSESHDRDFLLLDRAEYVMLGDITCIYGNVSSYFGNSLPRTRAARSSSPPILDCGLAQHHDQCMAWQN